MKKSVYVKNRIPAYVSAWADEYFHKSAFDVPVRYPNKKVINFLSQFKKSSRIKLFRGVNKYNSEVDLITSWTYDKNIAENYIQDGGEVIERYFMADKILLDTTALNAEQKKLLGYDYEIDDKEVLIINKIL